MFRHSLDADADTNDVLFFAAWIFLEKSDVISSSKNGSSTDATNCDRL